MNLKPIQIAIKIQKEAKVNIFENSRKRPVVEYRALLSYILREKLRMRWTNIANFFVKRGKHMTHASVIHACNSYSIYKKSNNKLEKIEKLFTFKNNLTYDEIDKVYFLENKIKNLEEKLQHPLIELLKTIPEKRYDETYERLRTITKSWEWKYRQQNIVD
tara:strand:+ start:7722 stop:8204 length:483 start_codon:yes stop_codon:yes gene_type:complete